MATPAKIRHRPGLSPARPLPDEIRRFRRPACRRRARTSLDLKHHRHPFPRRDPGLAAALGTVRAQLQKAPASVYEDKGVPAK